MMISLPNANYFNNPNYPVDEISHWPALFLTTVQNDFYWSATTWANPAFSWVYNLNTAQYGYYNKGDSLHLYYALAVHDGDISPAPVPEPATMLLLGTGIVGLFP